MARNNKLIQLRKMAGLSQEQAAKLHGLSSRSLRGYEIGERSRDVERDIIDNYMSILIPRLIKEAKIVLSDFSKASVNEKKSLEKKEIVIDTLFHRYEIANNSFTLQFFVLSKLRKNPIDSRIERAEYLNVHKIVKKLNNIYKSLPK